ncbi:hypothetical protein PM10SUCC1_19760 [Propionigenium maris DSM 9537]|uniref:HTH tetR-type domain-containing protein n=1 Tax=Propionigenium maris DSM 9537 TaxID=1123000 RepID=A0A9W6LNB6_9FUSO|nr:TetR/AcrR family transcriptional regulator [Propionigenium maris]GLI56462.1 hypothetical protein PM10SUCC1_19760 [Propionigenium maris DSM 9537]
MNSKKERLIKAGMFYFSINGIAATRVEDITKKAGVAKGTFYTYFSSKEDLLEDIMVQKMEKYVGLFNDLRTSGLDFEGKVKMYLRERFNRFVEDPKLFYMILSLRRTGEIMLLKFLREKLGRRGDKLIKEFFNENIEEIKEEYRGELDIILPSIMAALFSYQDIMAERVRIEVKDEEDYERISKILKRVDIEKYIDQFYNLNIKAMVKED